MQIQINSPHVDVPAAFTEFIEKRIPEVLGPFAERLTRVEVHLQDLNADKGGIDKRCMLEARPRGLDPVAVEVVAAEAQEAFRQALAKLSSLLEHRFGKLDSRQRGH
jgi:ribosomal subunit interface protein